MEETLEMRPSPVSNILFLLLCGVFVVLGVRLMPTHGWVAGLTIGFFGLGVVVFIVKLIPGSSYLRLDARGITVRTLYRTWRVNWEDVSDFFVARIGVRAMVCWNFRPGYTGQSRSRAFARGLTGVEAGLPDNYGRSAKALADLLNQWRTSHAGSATNTG